MTKTILKSYSKINLFLNVGKKNIRSKLHNVQSLVCLINIYDTIVISRIRANRDIVKFSGKFSSYVHKKKNSVTKCLLLLRSKGIIKKNQNVIFVFTGGTPAVFAYNNEIANTF